MRKPKKQLSLKILTSIFLPFFQLAHFDLHCIVSQLFLNFEDFYVTLYMISFYSKLLKCIKTRTFFDTLYYISFFIFTLNVHKIYHLTLANVRCFENIISC